MKLLQGEFRAGQTVEVDVEGGELVRRRLRPVCVVAGEFHHHLVHCVCGEERVSNGVVGGEHGPYAGAVELGERCDGVCCVEGGREVQHAAVAWGRGRDRGLGGESRVQLLDERRCGIGEGRRVRKLGW